MFSDNGIAVLMRQLLRHFCAACGLYNLLQVFRGADFTYGKLQLSHIGGYEEFCLLGNNAV
jgi:hypothetical protein